MIKIYITSPWENATSIRAKTAAFCGNMVFAHDEIKNGFIKCDTYAGGTDGQQITLGWEPQFILNKNMDGDGDWYENDDSSWYVHNNPRSGPAGTYINNLMNLPYSINIYGTIQSGTSGSSGC